MVPRFSCACVLGVDSDWIGVLGAALLVGVGVGVAFECFLLEKPIPTHTRKRQRGFFSRSRGVACWGPRPLPLLEASLLRVETVLRFERKVWSMLE